MSYQNRVDPFSNIVAHPARGMFTGNRGTLHGANGQLGKARWIGKRWIICLLDFDGRRKQVMKAGEYTNLFFLDEATALAAGHRPCFECRRADAKAYCAAIERVTGKRPSAADLDKDIFGEVGPSLRSGKREDVDASSLPACAMAASEGDAWLVTDRGMRRWSFDGYGPEEPFSSAPVQRLTPALSVAALRGGYRPALAAMLAGA
ncbi:MAG TPA: hypothetical protein VGO52_04800 [Hyphomonadaceae bacterium]|jgi:hypothetical protein|nr:hypothetical protein [Hyphomonadaceae bacterium]